MEEPLKVKNIALRNFRNYEELALSDIGDVCLFVGPNAIGKTNLIEAIQLLTGASSFRNPQTAHLIKQGADAASISARLEGSGRTLDIEAVFSEEGKSFYLNGKKKRASSLRGLLPSVVFCPDDLNLVKGSQSVRRRQLDLLGSQLSSNYDSVRKDYDKIIKQKNHYLKEEVDKGYLSSINEVAATVGAQLTVLRSKLLFELAPYMQAIYKDISHGGELLEVAYLSSWEKDSGRFVTEPVSREASIEQLLNAMDTGFERERERKLSLYGPHRDSILITLDGNDAGVFASQGQQRSIVLCFKMAEVALIKDKLGYSPVLLLDDVMSELDSSRRFALMSLVEEGIQTFITATNQDYFDESWQQQMRIYRLGEGGSND